MCGALSPREGLSCIHCGTRFGQQAQTLAPASIAPDQQTRNDDIVYGYIVNNGGEISLSKASADLRMTVPEIQTSIRRLENSGKIMQDQV